MENLLKIRASKAFVLMTQPKSKTEKEAGNLSETAKTYINDLWLENNYNYSEIIYSDPIMKGLLTEQDSIGLVQDVLGGNLRIKNTQYFENEYFKGTPDIILQDIIEDVKSSYSIKTFHNSELEKAYYWQGQVYMNLTGIKKYRLIYCLNDTPIELITNEKTKVYYKFGCNEENLDYLIASKQIEINNKYSHLPKKDRVKIFEFDYDSNGTEMLIIEVMKARKYYNSIKL